MTAAKYSTMAIIAVVFSLLFFVPLLPLIGVILGIWSLVAISNKQGLHGKGIAIAAIIIGLFVVVCQLLLFLAVYDIAGDLSSIMDKDPVESMNYCLEQPIGDERDVCIIMSLMIHSSETEVLDQNLCDNNIQDSELKGYCNAILKKDESYCSSITDEQARLDCVELIEQLKTQEGI
ncbi:MAG: DUF4190 domain-containing protein [bacterium]|nr:DUF4190 domain-containing protein [bacterium]